MRAVSKVPISLARNFLSPYTHQRASIRLIALRQSRQLARRTITSQSNSKRQNSSFAVERLTAQDAERSDAVLLGKRTGSPLGAPLGALFLYLNYMHKRKQLFPS